MKKTISINIGGVIFYIEEDGYDKLKSYLNSVHKYFSSFSDSTEIVADIEGRIAERFLQKQKNENKQVISESDVSELIAAMGTVSDFEAAENAEDLLTEPLASTPAAGPAATSRGPQAGPAPQTPHPRPVRGKFYRDLNRKILGGVAAGLAHYYAVDPLWIRLLAIVVVFGLLPFSGAMDMHIEDDLAMLSGIVILFYIAVWIAFPGSYTLEDNTKVKKFYRNPEKKVIGGVAAGISSYFNVDVGVVRFLWVISILFFGSGILIYIILWAIAPAANTLTEKMEMQGEPITLSNIETNIKKSLRLEDQGKESDLTRVLLFPFRAVAYLINALGRLLKGLGPILRILIGIFLIGAAGAALLSLLVAASFFLGLSNLGDFTFLPPQFTMLADMPFILVASIVVFIAIPLISILLLGLMLLTGKRVVGSTVWITMAGLWIAGIIGGVSTGVGFQRNFARHGEITAGQFLKLPARTLTIDQSAFYGNESVSVTATLFPAPLTDSLRIEKRLHAYGPSREDAQQMAARLTYHPSLKDSVLTLPEGPLYGKMLPFRKQHIEIALYIPYNKPFVMTRNFFFGMFNRGENSRNLDRYDLWNSETPWQQLRWAFLPDSGLVCLNMPERFLRKEPAPDNNEFAASGDEAVFEEDTRPRGDYIKQFSVPEFQAIDLAGAYHIRVKRASEWRVTADGREEEVEELTPVVEGGTLRIKMRNKDAAPFRETSEGIGLVILMPDLKSVSLSGSNKLFVSDFDSLRTLQVDISGASKGILNIRSKQLKTNLSGSSSVSLRGSIGELVAELTGACRLDAAAAEISKADVTANGASKAVMGRIPELKKSETGASKIVAE